MKSRILTSAAIAAALMSSAALAQTRPAQGGSMNHQGMNHANMAGMNHGGMAMQENIAAMQQMQQRMMAVNDADPDRAFALKMIEHHKGGIAMSEIVIKHGDDAEAKRMAQKTATMQRKEVAELENWLDRHGGRTPKP
jgi:uncharacterized protein (DUF305 family)